LIYGINYAEYVVYNEAFGKDIEDELDKSKLKAN
jgi:hypothetical protein